MEATTAITGSDKIKSAIIIYLLFCIVIFAKRPRIMFIDKDISRPRKFGLGKDKSLFSIHSCCLFLAIFVAACTFGF